MRIMAMEIPVDLIRKVQLATRKEAGLVDYDPDDPSLPVLPSLASLVASLDTSPEHVRCENCKGRLLRGLDSVICVYCGRQLRNVENVSLKPIFFNSTFGYRWLIDSLGLDGSETIERHVGEAHSNRGQKKPKDEIKLSDFLGLKVAWPPKFVPESTLANDSMDQVKNSLNFSGIDLSNLFPLAKKEMLYSTSEVHPIVERNIETSESKTDANSNNLSLFQTEQAPYDTNLSEGQTDDFSGWGADFQSAGHQNQHENTKSFDTFVRSTSDLSNHMDSVFGTGSSFDAKGIDELGVPNNQSNDLIKNDCSSTASQQAESLDTSGKVKHILTAENLENSPSSSVDRFQVNQFQTGFKNASSDKTIGEANVSVCEWNEFTGSETFQEFSNDSFDEWNDFTGSATIQDFSKEATKLSGDQVGTSDGCTSEIIPFNMTDIFQEVDSGSFSKPDLFSGFQSTQIDSAEQNDIFSEFTVSNSVRDNVSHLAGEAAKSSNDLLSTSTDRNDDLEMFMSQLHDLSFMLESNLSVPSKLDLNDSFQKK